LKPALHIKSDERDEARFVADTIIASVAEGRNWQQHAVLYRMNAQSNQLEAAFKRAGVPYRVYGGTGFYERAEIKDMLAYLCLIHNPYDDVRLLRVINTPARGIGPTTVARLAEIASEMNTPVFSVILDSENHASLQSSAGKLHLFADLITGLRKLAESAPLDELYENLLRQSGYIRMLEAKKLEENIARIENVNELKTNIISFMNENGGSLFDFLSETALYTDLDKDDQSTDRVMMMTMHSAKGLEFDTVFIAGAEEGLFPGSRSIGEPDEIEEERRLCYVAMTRAMRRLIFTSARQRMLFGKTSSSQPSRFLGEIDAGHIEIHYPPYSFGYNFDAGDGFDTDDDFAGSDFTVSNKQPYEGGFSKHYDRSGSDADFSPAGGFASSGSSNPGAYRSGYRARGGAGAGGARGTGRAMGGFAGGSAGGSVGDFAGRSAGGSGTAGSTGAGAISYKEGDIVDHKAFGNGVIIKATPAGGDSLLEIDFGSNGVKRLLLNSASRFMVKADSRHEQ